MQGVAESLGWGGGLGLCGEEGLAGEVGEGIAELWGVVDDDRAAKGEEHGSEELEAVAVAAEAGASVIVFGGDAPGGEGAGGFGDGEVDPDVDLVVGLEEGHVLVEVGAGVEFLGALEGFGAEFELGDAIEAEGADGFAGDAVADEIPAAVGVEDGVGLDLAAGADAGVGEIGEADAAAAADGGGGEDEGLGGGGDDPWAGFDGDDVFDSEEAFAEGFREDAAELGECAFGGGGEGGKAELAEGAEAEGEGEGFFVGEEQGGKAEAGEQAVGAANAACGLDGDAEVLEANDVALHGAEVDFEALGELGAGDVVAGLEDLEDGEDAHDWVIHRNLIIQQNYDRVCREWWLVSSSAQAGHEEKRDGD